HRKSRRHLSKGPSKQRVDLVTAQFATLAQRLGAVAEPVSLPIASRYCTLPSRIRSAVPVIRPLRSRNVVTLPLVELLPVIWPRPFRNVCCCATAGAPSNTSAAANMIALTALSPLPCHAAARCKHRRAPQYRGRAYCLSRRCCSATEARPEANRSPAR